MDIKNAFISELKDLLAKYNASIDFSASDCSDWNGMYGLCMEASFLEMENGRRKYTTVRLADGTSISASDI